MAPPLWLALLALCSTQFLYSEAAQNVHEQSFTAGARSGYYLINKRRYYVETQTPTAWLGAVSSCNARGMALVSLETAEESQTVTQYLQSLGILPGRVWSSGKLARGGGWLWTGSGLEFSPTPSWAPGEPDQEQLTCDAMLFSETGWEDAACGTLSQFMCEETEPQSGYHTINDRPYYIEANLAADWLTATAECNSRGMTLLSLESLQESQAVLDYLQDRGLSPWLMWTSGKFVRGSGWLWTGSGREFGYTNWAPGEPDLESQPCVATALLDGQWNDSTCATHTLYVCE